MWYVVMLLAMMVLMLQRFRDFDPLSVKLPRSNTFFIIVSYLELV